MGLKKLTGILAGGVMTLMATVPGYAAVPELVVAYFLEWPTPNQFAQANKLYEKELGIPVKWLSFDAGTAMSAAMASGDVHIAYSQGVTPFLVATAAGQDLTAIDIAVSYSDNDNCVVRSELEITAENVQELKGKKVAIPLGTAAHSGFLAQMKHFGIAEKDLDIVDMSPPDSAAAFSQPNTDLAMACGWGGFLAQMRQHGNVLLSGAAKQQVVGKVFDLTTTPTSFAEENPELISKFLAVTAKMNAMYNEDRQPMIPAIAKAAGMDVKGAEGMLDGFAFPSTEAQLSDEWMGGFLVKYLTDQAKILAEGGKITPLNDYSAIVDASYLETAAKM